MDIIKYFVTRKKVSNILLLFIIITGFLALKNLPRQDSPNVNFNILTITTYYPGASPSDVEINVTDKLEDELESVDGIEEMSSFSVESMSNITLQLDPNITDITTIKADIVSAIDRVSDLPPEVEDRPIIGEMKSTDIPVLEISIVGEEDREELIRKIAKDLESEIKSSTNAGKIEKIGYRKREVQVLVDLKKLEKNYISFNHIITAIKNRNVKLSGGTLESFVSEKKIVTFSEFEKLGEVGEVIVRSNYSGKHIRVSSVAKIKDGYKDREIISRTNGINSINMIVKRRGQTDIIDLSNSIDNIITKYKNIYEKQGIGIIKVVDYSYYTKSLLNIVTTNAMIGFCLVVISLFFFLNISTALWVALGIPVSVLGAYIFFPFLDVSTNQITLITMIMVLGMLVDDAIVIAENIYRRQEEGEDSTTAAINGAKEVFRPVLATILTTIICFIPMYFMKGIMGKFIMVIPTVVILTLLMSLVESTIILPGHLSLRKSKTARWKLNWINLLRKKYSKLLLTFIKFKKTTLMFAFSFAIIVATILLNVVPFELFPTEDFDLFYIELEAPVGTSLEETSRLVKNVEREVSLISKDALMGFSTIIGKHQTLEPASSPARHPNWSLITVFLKPASKRDVRSEEIILELNEKLSNIKDFKRLVVREMQDGPPVGSPITIRLISDEFELCEKYEKQILAKLKSMDGVIDINSSNRAGKKEVRIKLDYEYMSRLGITASDVASTIRVAYDGHRATSIRKGGEEIDFRIVLDHKDRRDDKVIKNLLLLNNQNRLVKLGKFITLEEGTEKDTIRHYDGKKAISITARVATSKISSGEANRILKEKFLKLVEAHPGVRIEFGGEEKEAMQSMDNFFYAFIVAMLGVYAILILLLNSFVQPFLIMVAIPFGIVGVLVAFYFHSLPLSFIGLIGVLGMIGVVVNDSLVMVTHLNTIKAANKLSLKTLVDGAATRLRPVLLTTITTVFGLFPTVYGFGGTEPFVVPMVLAMCYGLLFATLITLVLIPVLYSLLLTKEGDHFV